MQMEEKCVKRFDMVEGSFTLEPDKGINIDKILKIFGVDISGKPDSYTIQYLKTVQAKTNFRRK